MTPAPVDDNWQTHAGPKPTPEPQEASSIPQPLPAALGHKNPLLAGGLSLFPGMGNVYNGLYMRGITFFLVIASLIIISERHNIFGLGVAFFWIFNVIDAYRQATLINYGYAQDLGLIDLPRHPRASQGGIFSGILLSLIGLFAIADRYFVIDLEWLFDLWPFALVAIGVWLIVSAVRDRRRV